MRRPSPKRRAFSKVPPIWVAIRSRVAAAHLERVDPDFPPVAVETFGTKDVVRMPAGRECLELRNRPELARSVDGQAALVAPLAELDRLSGLLVEFHYVDRPRRNRPQLGALPDGPGAIRRLELALDRICERRELGVSFLLLDEHSSIGKDIERDFVPADIGRLDGRDDVPLAPARDAVDTGLPCPTDDRTVV